MADVPVPRSGAPAIPRARWPYHPGQATLLVAAITIVVGSLTTWVDTAFGSVSGIAGGGVWTLYAAVLALAGSMVRRRRLVVVHAVVVAVVALGIPAWQVVRLLSLGGLGRGWLPGMGLVLVLGGGALAASVASRLRPSAS